MEVRMYTIHIGAISIKPYYRWTMYTVYINIGYLRAMTGANFETGFIEKLSLSSS